MKKSISWSFRPYKPYFFEVGDIYICRVAPGGGYIHFEWLDEDKLTYSVCFRKRGEEDYSVIDNVKGCEYTISGLEADIDYEFCVKSGEKKSRVRLARTSEAVGTVVNYLHPDDKAYIYSGWALCSPSLVRLPSGALLASMDVYGDDTPQNLTLVFRSDDDGKTWHYQNEICPCFWGKMFIHRGELYMLSVSTQYGDLLISKSVDEGKTYEAPTVLMRGSGTYKATGVHKNPQNVLEHNGRLYTSCELFFGVRGCHAAGVLSCDADSDLLDADNWSYTQPIKFDTSWPGAEPYPSGGCIEGTVVLAPDGRLLSVMRYDTTQTEIKYGKVLALEIDTQNPKAPLKPLKAIKHDGNHAKFMIQKDAVSGYYYSIIDRLTDKEKIDDRRLLSLVRSKELDAFEVVCDLYDFRPRAEWTEEAMQYVDFFFEGDDILFLSRTSMNGSRDYHDANYSTFHRVKNFRTNPTVE